MFAPTNEAFAKLSSVFYSKLTEDADFATQLILFHRVPNEVLRKSDLQCDDGENTIEMGNGKNSRTLCKDDVPFYQKGDGNSDDAAPTIVASDLEVCNGVVHLVDQVLLF